MAAPPIKVDSVAKWYRLGTTSGPGATLAEELGRIMRAPGTLLKRRERATARASKEQGIWAVRDVSFELHRGEALGLIGRNGAGKSTLLKLLSRITLPTRGRLELRGRTATLLEVGTGFHPELTGRENIYLNGAVLGMKRQEIARKFDEIVEFSGVERFLETPVKRYSSGMYVRLGFAVAAHLDPDILIVDEVLAVGDGEFQRKCLGKMRDSASEGRAVVFVSHNLSAVQRLCTRAIELDQGRTLMDGSPEEVIAHYQARTGARSSGHVSIIPENADRVGTGEARLRQVALEDARGNAIDDVHLGQPLRVKATWEVLKPIPDACFEIGISSADGERVVTALSLDEGSPIRLEPGWQELTAEIAVTLLPHEFNLGIAITRPVGKAIDYVERAHGFTALRTDEFGSGGYPWEQVRGYVRPASHFAEPRRIEPPDFRPAEVAVESAT